MPLTQKAVLTVERDVATAEFHLRPELSATATLQKQPLVGPAGQNIRGFIGLLTGESAASEGVEIDLGAGEALVELRHEFGEDGTQWGVPNPTATQVSNAALSQLDVTGESPSRRANFFEWWIRHSTTDSRGGAKLYIGEYSDGTYATDPGIVGSPADVSIQSHDVPLLDADQEAARTLTVTVRFTDGDTVDDVTPDF